MSMWGKLREEFTLLKREHIAFWVHYLLWYYQRLWFFILCILLSCGWMHGLSKLASPALLAWESWSQEWNLPWNCRQKSHLGHTVRLIMNNASGSFLLNLPRFISLALSHIVAAGAPSHWKSRDNASGASHSTFTGNKCNQPKIVAEICAYLLPIKITDDHLSWTTYAWTDTVLCGHYLVWYNRYC